MFLKGSFRLRRHKCWGDNQHFLQTWVLVRQPPHKVGPKAASFLNGLACSQPAKGCLHFFFFSFRPLGPLQ